MVGVTGAIDSDLVAFVLWLISMVKTRYAFGETPQLRQDIYLVISGGITICLGEGFIDFSFVYRNGLWEFFPGSSPEILGNTICSHGWAEDHMRGRT